MSNVIIAGCDLHEKNMLLKIAQGSGKPALRSFGNTPSGRKAMIRDLRRRAKGAGTKRIVFAYEASCQGFGLYDELTDAEIECSILAPTKIARSPQHKRNKTDERDATRILEILRAHLLAGNALPSIWIPDPQTRDDRELVRTRLDVREKATRVKAQIQSHLKRQRLSKPDGVGKSWTKLHRAWLRGLVQPGTRLARGAWIALDTLMRQLAFLEEEIELLDALIGELAEQPRYSEAARALCEIRGVGLLTAMVFLTEMGDMSRFKNRRQVGAYLGLAPCAQESGETSDRKGHITCQGSGRVRKALCQATWVRIGIDEATRAARDRISGGKEKGKKIATVALMRRLAILMWHTAQRAQVGDPPTSRAA